MRLYTVEAALQAKRLDPEDQAEQPIIETIWLRESPSEAQCVVAVGQLICHDDEWTIVKSVKITITER